MQTTFLSRYMQLVPLTAVALLGASLQAVLGSSTQFYPKNIQASDDRGSGRVFPQLAKGALSPSFDLLAFRGSGRLDNDGEQPEKSHVKTTSPAEQVSTFFYRGSGRITQLQVNWA
ncbi:MAG TPA: hypothetical protein V6D29_16190 [Leptolyngbyaceae cyanobacterium]